MNTKMLSLIGLGFILLCTNGYAQNEPISTELTTEQLQQIEQVFQTESRRETTSNNNNVFIQQVGSGNTIFSNISSKSSRIELYQNGDNNSIKIDETSDDIQKFISQTGSDNSVIDFSNNPELSTKLELIQDGNQLIFERSGVNELTKSLKFKMTGNDRSILVRSF